MYDTIRDRSNKLLEDANSELSAARDRKVAIEKAIETLAKNGAPQEALESLMPTLDQAADEMRTAMVHRMLVRDGMKFHDWYPDNN